MKKSRDRNPTVREVANLAGVGQMTVSRVLNNQPTVRPSTRKRVLSAIAELGYKRNEAARMLKGLPITMIGLIVPDLADSFFASCAQIVQHIARAHGYMTLIAASERDSEAEIEQVQLMASRNLSGIAIATSTLGDDLRLRQLQDAGLPIVDIWKSTPDAPDQSQARSNQASRNGSGGRSPQRGPAEWLEGREIAS